jgi:PAS domain S-box-containing protein/putative nucleotidyltransferase with HDIG domain
LEKKKIKILIVEDSEDDAILLIRWIKKDGLDPIYKRIDSLKAMKAALNKEEWNIILSDYSLSKFNALDALNLLIKNNYEIPFIIVSGTVGEDIAVKTMKKGANDYLMKDNLARLVPSIKRELQEIEIKRERREAIGGLVESEKRFKELAELLPAVIVETDSNDKITFANHTFYKLTGYLFKDVNNGMHIYRIIVPEERVNFQENLKKHDGRSTSEYTVLKKNGDIYPVIMYCNDICNGHDKRIGSRIVMVDITERKRAEYKIEESYKRLQKTLNDTINTLASIIENRDPYTSGHQKKVAYLAINISEELGLSDEETEALGTAAMVHDIGKITIPASILSKPGKVSDVEYKLIKTHSRTGYEIIKNIEFPYPIEKIILQHHERLDGSGYPLGLKDKDIMFEAKILAVADVVEAMSSHRPYRPALGINKALEEIDNNKGILYDTNVVEACKNLFTKKKFEF